MLTCFIRNFFVLFVAIFSFYKLLNIKPTTKYVHIFLMFATTIISFCSAVLFANNQSLNWLFIILFFILIIKSVTTLNVLTLLTTILFSFSLSFVAFSFSTILTSLVLFPFYYKQYHLPLFLIRIFIGGVHFSLILCCFHIPRLQKGMTFLYYIPSNNIGSTLCILLIMLIIMFNQVNSISDSYILAFFSIILLSGFLLIYWWNYHITQTYRKYLWKNEINALNLLLKAKNNSNAASRGPAIIK